MSRTMLSEASIDVSGHARLSGVDVLRGLSVLLVTLHHIHLRFWLNGYGVDHVLPAVINQVLFWSGYYAVIVFFVISGFLITGLSIRRWGRLAQIQVGRFYSLRAARILPSLVALLLVLSALHLCGSPTFRIPATRASLGQALWSALTFSINWLEGRRGYLPGTWDVLWSLSVEEVFYLSLPLLCVLLRRDTALLLLMACLIFIGPINRTAFADQDPWGHYAYLSCMDGIAFGCLAALAVARLRLRRNATVRALLGRSCNRLPGDPTCNEDSHGGLARYGLNVTLLELGTALMLLALGNGVGNNALSTGTGWLREIGRGSYEIYLVHMLAVLGLMDCFKSLQSPTWTIPLWYLAMLLLSIVLGLVVSKYYSDPMNHRLRASFPTQRHSADSVKPKAKLG